MLKTRSLRLLPVLALVGCDQLSVLEAGDGEVCIPPAVQESFDDACALGGCHDPSGGAAGLVLSAPSSANVLVRSATQRSMPLVSLGDLDSSYVAHKLMLDPPEPIVGARMPIGFDLSDADQVEDVATIVGWIAGAPLEGCSPDEPPPAADDDGTTGAQPQDRGLPCEVDELLELRCRGCHSDPPVGAPFPLVTRGHLLAPSPGDPNLIVARGRADADGRCRRTDASGPPRRW